MKRFKKILVPLELAESDRAVLAVASRIARWAEPDEIRFCHFVPETGIPEAMRDKHSWLSEAMDKVLLTKLEETVHQAADMPAGCASFYQVSLGNPSGCALACTVEHDVDLVIVSSSPPQMALRLARKAPCSVCVVPPEAPTEMARPLVAVDFSDHSRLAADVGHALARESGGGLPELLNISRIHTGYRWSTLSTEEFIAMNDAHARKEMDRFVATLEFPAEGIASHIHHHESVPYGILDFAERSGADCLVAGCRGKDALSALLLGSDIEQVIAHARIPVLAVKIKGTGRTFLEELLGMNR